MRGVLAMVLAGGAGERLLPLTKGRSKSAVPFAGKFRLIDFTLSNCVNSGIRQIFVLTQYRSGSLIRHIQEGWALSSSRLGEFVYCVPAQQKTGTDWYRGTADAIRQNLDLVRGFEDILILSADHVYKMDYLKFLTYHKRHNADLTISAIRVKKEEAAKRLGVIEVDRDCRIIGFEEKPAEPKTIPNDPEHVFASMGVYLFKPDALIKALQLKGDDFGREIIPKMMGGGNTFAYDYVAENKIEDFIIKVREGRREKILVDKTPDSSYWRDVGTIESYYEACMDLVSVKPAFNLYGERWPFRTYQRLLPPSKFILGGKAIDSIICDGCIISGATVFRSILSPGVIVEMGSLVEESIIFDDVIIEPGAKIRRAIIDKRARVHAGASLGYDLGADRRRGCTISNTGIVVVPEGADITQG